MASVSSDDAHQLRFFYLCTALVLAPFFVHVELLFRLGYRPEFQKALHNDIGQEIARIKKAEGDKKRADELDEELKEEQEL